MWERELQPLTAAKVPVLSPSDTWVFFLLQMSGGSSDTSVSYGKGHKAVMIVLLLRTRGTDGGCRLSLHTNCFLNVFNNSLYCQLSEFILAFIFGLF